MEKAYKYRLYPNKAQQESLEKHFGATRWVFNYGLQRKIEEYQKNKKNLSCFQIANELPKLKEKEETKWLKEINAQSLQMALRQLDNAYTAFFKKQSSFPKFKSKKNKKSFSLPQYNKIDFENEESVLSKIGKIKIAVDRRFEGRIIRATISKNSINQYFVSYIVDSKEEKIKPKKIMEKTTIGIDLGIKDFAVLSDGQRIENPRILKKSEQRLKILQRRLSRKEKGSQNRIKTRCKVAKLYNKISNQRSDFLHKLTHKLTHENQVDTYVLETLKVKNMIKNHCLARSILDAGWSEFIRQMKYKCDWYGKNLLFVGQFEPSSKMCGCGHIKNDLTLADREWKCEKCGIINDRDLLASQNIKRFAFRAGDARRACGVASLEER
jgi:putative transposase